MSERRRIIVPRRGQPWVITLAPDMSDEGLQSCFHIVLRNRSEALRYVNQGLQQSDEVKRLIDEAWPSLLTQERYESKVLPSSQFGYGMGIVGDVQMILKSEGNRAAQPAPELLVLEMEVVGISRTQDPAGDLCLIVKSGLTFDQAIGLSLQHKFQVVLQEVKE